MGLSGSWHSERPAMGFVLGLRETVLWHRQESQSRPNGAGYAAGPHATVRAGADDPPRMHTCKDFPCSPACACMTSVHSSEWAGLLLLGPWESAGAVCSSPDAREVGAEELAGLRMHLDSHLSPPT